LQPSTWPAAHRLGVARTGRISAPPPASPKREEPERGWPQPQRIREGVGLEILLPRCVFGAAAAGDSRAPAVVPRNACIHPSLIEVLAVVANITILAKMLFPARTKANTRVNRIAFLAGLKLFGLGFTINTDSHKHPILT